MKIKKACILLGGYGTRMLPITKTIPKEMLPINNYPNIFYIVKELYQNGIKDITFVITKRNKKIIENFFTIDKELDNELNEEKKQKLDELYRIINNVKFTYVYQRIKGTYGALYSAKQHLDNYFLVIYGDEYIKGNTIEILLENFKKQESMYILAKENDKNLSRGLLKLDNNQNLIDITTKEKSNNLELIGRMIISKEIFKIKSKLQYYGKELYLPHSLLNYKNVKCIIPKNIKYYNIGEIDGYIKAIKGE